MHLLDACEEVGTDTVHLVDICNLWHAVLVCLTPYGLGLRLNAADSTESGDCSVKDAERTLHLDSEVNVARSIDQVDLIDISLIMPECGGSGRSDGDTPLLLLHHPVHRSCTFVDLTDLVGLSGVEKNALRSRSLTGIDVSHDTDIPCEFKISLCHLTTGLETEVSESLVGLSHLVHILLSLVCTTFVVVSCDDFGAEFFCHGVAGTLAGVEYQILHRYGNLPLRSQLCRHLEVGTADTA